MDNPEMVNPEIDSPEIDKPEIDSSEIAAPESDPDTHRFECRSCGFVYDPEEGVKKLGIEVNTHSAQLIHAVFVARCVAAQWVLSAISAPATNQAALKKILNLALA